MPWPWLHISVDAVLDVSHSPDEELRDRPALPGEFGGVRPAQS